METHTAAEVEKALDAGADIIGVNNRDLGELAVDLGTFEAVAPESRRTSHSLPKVAFRRGRRYADARRRCGRPADGSAIMDHDAATDVEANTRRLTRANTKPLSQQLDLSTDDASTPSSASTVDSRARGADASDRRADRRLPAVVLENEDGSWTIRGRLADFGGRPTPLQCADQLSERYDREVYLKREDLLHGGAHKLNNALGQVLLAKYMGKERIIAETGAGQHGTATAMACAHLDMPCEIYMGERDINRQRPNVFRMKLNGSEVNPVTVGRGTLKEAISETMRDWATNVEDTHYVIGSVVGPHPFPSMVRDFQSVISEEARTQAREKLGRLPDAVVACAGGGSNTMGAFAEFVDDEESALYAVEAGGSTLEGGRGEGRRAELGVALDWRRRRAPWRAHEAPAGSDGQIMESHSVSSGLDYAGVGPELAHLVDEERVTPSTSTTTSRWRRSTASHRTRVSSRP